MNPTAEVRAFFDAFVEAFRHFDGNVIAQRYRAPYLAVNDDGSTSSFTTESDIGAYFQQVLEVYHRHGCRTCRYKDLDVKHLGEKCGLCTVIWELLGEDGGVISGWRETYLLVRGDEGLRVVASVDHK